MNACMASLLRAPAYQRVFRTAELAEMILKLVPRSSLPSVACTCSTLRVPANALIWRHINKMALDILYQILADPAEYRVAHFGSSAVERLRHFEFYASFVRELDLDLVTEGRDHPHIHEPDLRSRLRLEHLTSTYAPLTLLPQMRSLKLRVCDSRDLSTAMPFLVPSLQDISLDCAALPHPHNLYRSSGAWDYHMEMFFHRIQRNIPELNSLSLTRLHYLSSNLLDNMENVIALLPHLRVFGGDSNSVYETSRLLSTLARKKGLEELRLHIPTMSSRWVPALPSGSPDVQARFVDLRRLDIHGSKDLLVAFLDKMWAPLEELVVKAHGGTLPLTAFAAQVRARGRVLKKLHVTVYGDGAPFLWGTFGDLFECHSICDFSFAYPYCSQMDLRDTDMLALSRAWPLLRTLSITWGKRRLAIGGLFVDAPLSLLALSHLAHSCPSLHTLTLSSLDASGPVPAFSNTRCCRPPVDLNVELMPVQDASKQYNRVALYISTFWTEVSITTPPESRFHDVWCTIEELLELLHLQTLLQSDPEFLNV